MRKIAFVFPGQGSQYVGMGKDLYAAYPIARKIFKLADQRLGMTLSKLCFEGPEEELRLTVNTQPAILTVSVAILKIAEAMGLKADYAAGHSLGEFSALVAARALNFEDAVRLVRQRGIIMQEAVPPGEGTMAAMIGLEADRAEALCHEASAAGTVELANYNCPGQLVIAGTTGAIHRAVELAKDYGAKRAVLLAVSGPFHSSLLHPASLRLREALDSITIRAARIPVVANYTAEPETAPEEIRENLIKQVSGAVRWQQSVEKLAALGVTTFVEIGPGKVLTGLIKKVDKSLEMYNIEDGESLKETLAALGGGIRLVAVR